jgi:hypothetical protein
MTPLEPPAEEIAVPVSAPMEAVAERVVALLEEGRIRIVDFAAAPAAQDVIRAACYLADGDAP